LAVVSPSELRKVHDTSLSDETPPSWFGEFPLSSWPDFAAYQHGHLLDDDGNALPVKEVFDRFSRR
jgi:hypothetical protein